MSFCSQRVDREGGTGVIVTEEPVGVGVNVFVDLTWDRGEGTLDTVCSGVGGNVEVGDG